jgi:SAM-dependent MidA family methyltransferase
MIRPEEGRASPLDDRLRERIRTQGPLTFAEFMESALYDPEHGFYSRSPVGEQGDFVTSPHVSSLFGQLLAVQITEYWELLGRPDRFDLVEVGAGSGLLARQVLQNLPPELAERIRYRAVDRSPSARDSLSAMAPDLGGRVNAEIDVVEALRDLGAGLIGCLVANELLDNLPFHRVKGTGQGLVELFVAVEGDRFVLAEGPPSDPEIERVAPSLSPGEEAVVNLSALKLLGEASGLFQRGYLWFFDYGWVEGTSTRDSSGRHRDFVHGYRRHRVEQDVLAEPGSRDITAGIDFEALVRRARGLDLRIWGPLTQRDVFFALGYREWDEDARIRQVRATADRDGLQAMNIYSDRNRAAQLVDRMGLGAFLVLCLGVGPVPDRAPRSVAEAS